MHHQPAQQDHPATGGHDWWRTALGNALQHYGLTPETLGHYCGQRPAGSLLSPDDNRELWSRACRDADDPLLGLRLHRLSLPAPILALQFACLTSASLGQAIDCLIEHAELFSPGLQIRHSTANRLTCQSDQPLPAPLQDAISGYLCRLLQQLSPLQPLVEAITLGHAHQDRQAASRLLGDIPLQQGAAWQLTLAGHDASATLQGADSELHLQARQSLQLLQERLPARELSQLVTRQIRRQLGDPGLNLERIAQSLNISPRHLRRKLGQQGSSYDLLYDGIRRDQAEQLVLQGRLSLTSIAYELGFNGPSSFSRAFRRWTGSSPTRWREQQTGSSAD